MAHIMKTPLWLERVQKKAGTLSIQNACACDSAWRALSSPDQHEYAQWSRRGASVNYRDLQSLDYFFWWWWWWWWGGGGGVAGSRGVWINVMSLWQ